MNCCKLVQCVNVGFFCVLIGLMDGLRDIVSLVDLVSGEHLWCVSVQGVVWSLLGLPESSPACLVI